MLGAGAKAAGKKLSRAANPMSEISRKPPHESAGIEVRHICKRFGSLAAVDDISFAVKPGEIFGLLGPNGAGKSTLIRILTTLIDPTSGTATVAGHDIVQAPYAVREAIGVIPQNMTSDPDLTCEENLTIHARLYGMSGARRKTLARQLLESVNLGKWAKAYARTLSGGMRRRLEIARGLIHQPRILFLDEPTTGLDPVSRMSVWEMISHLRDQQGLTLFLTTHYMDEADRLCDRLAIVDRGKIVVLNSPAALKTTVPGASVLETQLAPDLPGGAAELETLPGVHRVQKQGEAIYRIFSDHGPNAAEALMDLARRRGIEIKTLSIQSTTLDDVFLHFTGRGLHEADAVPARGGMGRTAPF